jgi:hypothetical protein
MRVLNSLGLAVLVSGAGVLVAQQGTNSRWAALHTDVLFADNRTDLTDSAMVGLDGAVRTLRTHPETRLVITDFGSAADSGVSIQRAWVMVGYFQFKGINTDRIEIKTRGLNGWASDTLKLADLSTARTPAVAYRHRYWIVIVPHP